MSVVQHFSTPFRSGKTHIRLWNDIATRSSPGLSIDMTSSDFSGELYRWRLPRVTMLWASAAESVVHRHARKTSEERILLHIQGRGHCRQSHRDHVIDLMPGDLSLCSSHDLAMLETNAHDMIVADLPRDLIERKVTNVAALCGTRMPGSSPSVVAFRQFMIASWREAMTMHANPGAQWCSRFENVLADLVALAFSSPSDDAGKFDPGSRLMETVNAQLHDPELDVDALAAQLGVSRRTIQMRFAGMNTTATGFIRSQRLSRSADLLIANPGASITAIAFECGFNDAAYFTRSFTRHYGMAPTAWRKAAR